MRTVSFLTILNEALQLSGLDRDAVTAKTFKTFRDLCSLRLSEVWEREAWPFLQRFQQRSPGRAISSFSTSAGSSLVTFTTPYQAWAYADLYNEAVPVNVNVTTELGASLASMPQLSGGFPWTTYSGTQITLDCGTVQTASGTYSVSPECGALASTNEGKLRIVLPSDCEAVLGLWTADPRGASRAVPVAFAIESVGQQTIGGTVQDTGFATVGTMDLVWLQYRTACPRLSGDDYSAATQYYAGDQVYYGGHFYDCVADAFNVLPTVTANWKRVDIPNLFRTFLVRSVLSDYLRSESQYEQAMAAEADAQAAYERAVDVVLRQEQQSGKLNMVFTY